MKEIKDSATVNLMDLPWYLRGYMRVRLAWFVLTQPIGEVNRVNYKPCPKKPPQP